MGRHIYQRSRPVHEYTRASVRSYRNNDYENFGNSFAAFSGGWGGAIIFGSLCPPVSAAAGIVGIAGAFCSAIYGISAAHSAVQDIRDPDCNHAPNNTRSVDAP
jgi:hypothetical protein